MLSFYNQCNRDQLIIQQLIAQNSHFRSELEKRKTNDEIKHPLFLKQLIEQSIKQQSGKALSYSEHLKKVSLYILMQAGPLVYDSLHKNLPLPSLTSVKRYLGKESPMIEGAFQFDIIKDEIKKNNESNFVWIAEDDTKITSRLRYNLNTDCVMGLELPLDQKGIPIQNFFKFTSIAKVQEYIDKYSISSYVKLLTCRSMSPSSKPFLLVMYGTKGSDKSDGVRMRWSYIFRSFFSIGINVLGKYD